MNLFSLFKSRGTAPVARERLQILLAHERVTLGPANLIAMLRDEILATIARHVEIAPEAVKIKMGNEGSISTLEIDVEIPTEKIGAKRKEAMRVTAAA
jgi:cell division topological specificity factor